MLESFDKKFIMRRLGQLETIIYDALTLSSNLDLEKYKDLFTNDFSFQLFKKCIQTLMGSTVVSDLDHCRDSFLTYIADNLHTNAFLLINNKYLFGVNDDGKIFVINDRPIRPKIPKVYELFGYEYDIVDLKHWETILNEKIIEYNNDQLTVNLSTMKYFSKSFTLRIAGDLIVECDIVNFIIEPFKTLFQTFINQKLVYEFVKYDLISHDGIISFTKSNIDKAKTFSFVVNIVKQLLNDLGLQITDVIHKDKSTIIVINFANCVWDIKLTASSLNKTFTITACLEIKEILSTFTRKQFIQQVLKLVAPDLKDQTITLHLGNHKIIVRGYYLPVIHIGNEFVSIDNIFANKMLFEHPEHHTVHAIFSDTGLVRFMTATVGRNHRKLRNEYTATRLKK